MSGFNGSGVFSYSFSWANDAANSIPITASRMDTQFADSTGGFNLCVTRDGQGSPSADIPWNNHKITGLATATTTGDALSYGRAATVTTLSTSGLATLASMAVTAGLPGNFANTGTATVNASSTSGTLALPLGGGVIILTQSGPIGSGATALVYHNQASIVAITTLGTAISTGSTNIASINLVTNGFTVTTGAVGGATSFSYLVITTP